MCTHFSFQVLFSTIKRYHFQTVSGIKSKPTNQPTNQPHSVSQFIHNLILIFLPNICTVSIFVHTFTDTVVCRQTLVFAACPNRCVNSTFLWLFFPSSSLFSRILTSSLVFARYITATFGNSAKKCVYFLTLIIWM